MAKASQHRKFDQGMNRDVDSALLPEGYLYTARNVLFDKLGVARKRGGITALGGTTTYNYDQLCAMVDESANLRVYARPNPGGANTLYVDTATGSFTSCGPGNAGGRPFTHYGFMAFPGLSSTIWVAGATGSVAARTFGTPTSVTVTAGDKRITCAAGDSPTTLMQVGQLIEIIPNGGPITYYNGRVTALISTTAFEVYPTPGISMSGAGVFSAQTFLAGNSTANGIGVSSQGACGMSFQGRVVLGNISRVIQSPARTELYPRRVVFSSTLLEQDTTGSATRLDNGATWLSPNGFPLLNYFDIPAQEAITAMSPTGFGDALIFTAFRTYRLTGNLSTQFGTEQSITWSPREIPNSVGCMSERSLQRTPRGVIFAHDSGIYSTDGNSMQPLMYQRMANYWNTLAAPGNAFAIYGSALIRGNHYYICGVSNGSPWGLLVNLDTLAWGTIDGKAAVPACWIINSSAQNPSDPTRTWGLKTITNFGGSSTGGQLVRLDDMFRPTSANRVDTDAAFSFEIVTPPYSEGSQSLQKTWLDATLQYNNIGGAEVTVTPGFVLDSADMAAAAPTGGRQPLDLQDVATVTAASNAIPIVLTAGTHNISQDTWVRVAGVAGNTAANGLWRVQAVTATTITLMGSSGNAAYTSGGTVSAVDQKDVSLLNQQRLTATTGQNMCAVAYRINDSDTGSPGADSFELLSITHTWEERDDPSE